MWTALRDELREIAWLVTVIGALTGLSVGIGVALAVVV